jgi:hypothetical protein
MLNLVVRRETARLLKVNVGVKCCAIDALKKEALGGKNDDHFSSNA